MNRTGRSGARRHGFRGRRDQPGNNAVASGFKASTRGLLDTMNNIASTSARRDNVHIRQAVGIFGEVKEGIAGLAKSLQEELTLPRMGVEVPTDKFVRGLLTYGNFFAPAEMFNRTTAAFTGRAIAGDILTRAKNGKLRGDQLAIARRQMRGLGLDLDELQRLGFPGCHELI